jgi:hypothetical protein
LQENATGKQAKDEYNFSQLSGLIVILLKDSESARNCPQINVDFADVKVNSAFLGALPTKNG